MRLLKQIPLGSNRTVTVQEVTVRIARLLIAAADSLENLNVNAVLGERFPELVALLGDCVIMPEGETLEDLSFSETELVQAALLEVNAAFLARLGLALEKAPGQENSNSSSSTETASP